MKCPSCSARVGPQEDECRSCGYPLHRLCRCGVSYHAGLGRCPACACPTIEDTPTKRDDGETAAPQKKRGAGIRSFECPGCSRTTLKGAETCDRCGESLRILCSCGAIFLASELPSCPACGRLPGREHKRSSRSSRRRLALLLVLLLLTIGGAVTYLTIRRAPDGMALYRQGRTLLVAGNQDDAIPLLRQAADLLPSDPQIRFTLAAALQQQGKTDDAERELRLALRSDPGKDEALILLGQILVDRGDYDEAAEMFRRSLADQSQPREAYQLLAALGERRNDLVMLIEALDGETMADSDSPDAMLRLAEAHMQRYWRSRDPRVKEAVSGALGGCLQRCDVALDLRPDTPAMHLMRAQALVRLELWGIDSKKLVLAELARGEAKGASGAELVDAEIAWASALAAEADGQQEKAKGLRAKALASMRKIALAAPTEGEALRIVRLLEYQGTGEDALNLLAGLRKKWVASTGAVLASARVLLRTGRSGEALRLMKEAREGGLASPEISSAIVLGHMWAGDWAGAAEEADRLRRRGEMTRDVLAFEVIARCELAAGSDEIRAEEMPHIRAILDGQPRVRRILDGLPRLEGTEDVDWLVACGRFLMLSARARGEQLTAEARDEISKGLVALREGFRRNPGDLPSGLWLAQGLMRLHRGPTDNFPDQALEVLSRMLTTAPEWLPVRVRMAEVCLRTGLAERAMEHARFVLERNPKDVGVRMTLALACVALGEEREAEAIEELERIRSESPTDMRSRLLLGRVYLRQGHPALARERFDEARSAAADDESRRKVIEDIAKIYGSEGLADQAVAMLEQLVKDNPGSSLAKMAFADLLVSLGRQELALNVLREISQANPGDVAVRRRICEVYFELGKDAPEIELIIADLRARDAGSEDVVFLAATHQLLLARQAMGMDRRVVAESLARSAVDGLEKYVESRSDDPKGHFALGVARFLLGDLEGAAGALQAASDRGAGGAPYAVALSRVQSARANRLLADGHLPEAIELLNGVILLDPVSTYERKILASALLRMGREGASERQAREVLRRNEEDPEAWVLLGNILRRGRRLDDASQAYAKAVDISPDNTVWRILLGQTLMSLGQTDRALLHLEGASKQAPESEPVLRLWVQALLDCGRSAQALELAEGWISKNQRDAFGYELAGICKLSRAELDAASEALDTALKLAPDRISTLSLLMELEANHKGDVGRALVIAKGATEANPKNVQILLMLGRCQIVAEQVTDAIATFTQIVWLEPDFEQGRQELAKLQFQMGRVSQAEKTLAPLLPQASWRTEIAMLQAMIQARLDAPALAEKYYLMVLEFDPENGIAMNNLAWQRAQHRQSGAQSLAKKALDLAPDDPDRLDTYGFVLAQMGKPEEAANIYSRSITGFKKQIEDLDRASRDVERHPKHVRAKLTSQANRVRGSLAALEARYATVRRQLDNKPPR
jgi:tetratricopeptide (TPR) repeat protein